MPSGKSAAWRGTPSAASKAVKRSPAFMCWRGWLGSWRRASRTSSPGSRTSPGRPEYRTDAGLGRCAEVAGVNAVPRDEASLPNKHLPVATTAADSGSKRGVPGQKGGPEPPNSAPFRGHEQQQQRRGHARPVSRWQLQPAADAGRAEQARRADQRAEAVIPPTDIPGKPLRSNSASPFCWVDGEVR